MTLNLFFCADALPCPPLLLLVLDSRVRLADHEGRTTRQRNSADSRIRGEPDRITEVAALPHRLRGVNEEDPLGHDDGVLPARGYKRKAEVAHVQEPLRHPLSCPQQRGGLPGPQRRGRR